MKRIMFILEEWGIERGEKVNLKVDCFFQWLRSMWSAESANKMAISEGNPRQWFSCFPVFVQRVQSDTDKMRETLPKKQNEMQYGYGKISHYSDAGFL